MVVLARYRVFVVWFSAELKPDEKAAGVVRAISDDAHTAELLACQERCDAGPNRCPNEQLHPSIADVSDFDRHLLRGRAVNPCQLATAKDGVSDLFAEISDSSQSAL